MREALSNLPKVDELLKSELLNSFEKISHSRIIRVVRDEIEKARAAILSGALAADKPALFSLVAQNTAKRLDMFLAERLQGVINATGVVVHTNLGRAPLSPHAISLVSESAGYCNLEYSLEEGQRKNRMRYLEGLLCDLTGAEAALVVNNNAAAVFLTLNSLSFGKDVILSRGELVEIGDAFRVNELMAASGCRLIEVGTTNKTYDWDYEKAITDNTSALLKVHTSNFKILGFTENLHPRDCVALAHKHGLLAIEDMGSGAFIDTSRFSLPKERTVAEAIADGVDIATFSGDKILGGPQAGIIVGKKQYVDLLKKNQLLRALRLDKLGIAALIGTLEDYISDPNQIPTIKYLTQDADSVRARAEALLEQLGGAGRLIPHESRFGGGAMPMEVIPSWAVAITIPSPDKLAYNLRKLERPIVGLVSEDMFLINLRCVEDDDISYIARSILELIQ